MTRPALSASRAIDVLQYLAAHPDDAFTYAELSRRLGVNLASLHAVLHELEQRRFVNRDPVTRQYTLGLALVATGDAALRHHRAVDLLRREMTRLASRLGRQCVAYAPVRSDMLCVATSYTDRSMIQVGQRVPLVAPFGTVFVAWSDDEVVRRWLDRAGIGGVRRSRALDDLRTVRRRGYSATADLPGHRDIERLVLEIAEHPQEVALQRRLRRSITASERRELDLRPGSRSLRVRDVSAPVFDQAGAPAFALTLQGFDAPIADAELRREIEALRRVTASVTTASGGTGPHDPRVTPAGQLARADASPRAPRRASVRSGRASSTG